MRTPSIFALSTLGLIAAIPTANAQQATLPELRPLEFLVGSCWRGTFPDGKQTDQHCFEWMYDGKFIRDRHEVRGGPPYRGETVYGVDPVAKRVMFTYWSSDGMTMTGHVEPKADTLLFPVKLPTPKGEVELKAVWTRRGADTYHVVQSQRSGNAWKTMWEMDFTRMPK